jgi:hypothetical protein
MAPSPEVSFLVAGVQKGGTTALFTHLVHDLPSVQMAPEKEVHFFDDETRVDWSAPDYGRLHDAFPAKDGRPRGEVTPIYVYWPESLERIARYNPAMKLVLLFRDPVRRAWSHWRMEYARGWESEPFAWCIREGRARVDSAEAPGFHRVFSYVERGFYAQQLERLLTLFPREQLLLLTSDELKADPGGVLGRIAAFLGAEPPAGPVAPRRELEARPIDYGQAITADDVAHLRGIYADDTRRFAMLSGLPVAGWLGGDEG